MVDTNVLVSAVLSPDGAAREVLRRCLAGHARPLVGNALFLDYEDVLAREARFTAASITPNDRAALLEALLSVCEWFTSPSSGVRIYPTNPKTSDRASDCGQCRVDYYGQLEGLRGGRTGLRQHAGRYAGQLAEGGWLTWQR